MASTDSKGTVSVEEGSLWTEILASVASPTARRVPTKTILVLGSCTLGWVSANHVLQHPARFVPCLGLPESSDDLENSFSSFLLVSFTGDEGSGKSSVLARLRRSKVAQDAPLGVGLEYSYLDVTDADEGVFLTSSDTITSPLVHRTCDMRLSSSWPW